MAQIYHNKMNYSEEVLEEFWSRIDYPLDWQSNSKTLNHCWEWIMQSNEELFTDKEIPIFTFGEVCQSARRFMYESCYGRIPNGISIFHKKRLGRGMKNKTCMNPNHLTEGIYSNLGGGRYAITTEEDLRQIIDQLIESEFESTLTILKKYKLTINHLIRIINMVEFRFLNKHYSDCKLEEISDQLYNYQLSRSKRRHFIDFSNKDVLIKEESNLRKTKFKQYAYADAV